MRENNERMQRLTEMNTLYKPVRELIDKNDCFFQGLGFTSDIIIIGHSCEEVDYPYFSNIKESVHQDTLWHFNPHSGDDWIRENKLIKDICITNFVFNA